MRFWILLIATGLVLGACEREAPVRKSANEGNAAQSAAGGSANEGKAARSATGRY